MKINENTRKIASALWVLLLTLSPMATAMEEKGTDRSGLLRNNYATILREIEALTTRIHREVDKVLADYRRDTEEYHQRMGGKRGATTTQRQEQQRRPAETSSQQAQQRRDEEARRREQQQRRDEEARKREQQQRRDEEARKREQQQRRDEEALRQAQQRKAAEGNKAQVSNLSLIEILKKQAEEQRKDEESRQREDQRRVEAKKREEDQRRVEALKQKAAQEAQGRKQQRENEALAQRRNVPLEYATEVHIQRTIGYYYAKSLELLELGDRPTSAEVKKAYLKFAMVYHPDKTAGDPEKEEKFKEITKAYEYIKLFQEYADSGIISFRVLETLLEGW